MMAAGLLVVPALQPALAHRLDEYLQATILSIEPGSVQATIRLVPGVAVAPAVIAEMDGDRDGRLSEQEQRRYAERVLGDVEVAEDGGRLPLKLVSARFPSLEAMRAGTGEIEIAFWARLGAAAGGRQELTFANHHRSAISVYLVNSLVPRDGTLRLSGQSRSQDQSFYEVTLDAGGGGERESPGWSGFAGAFRLGVRHIAEGSDHLLFLLTLLLPAPLVALGGRWSGRATMRQSARHVLGIVTAFTVGHSLTLALSCFGLVALPRRPVEVLIAVSILVSAVHAMRPLFAGREAAIAGMFGLVHGLAFASALSELGVTGWYRVVSLLGFNVGIEAMQLAVVAVALPPMLLLSRTDGYLALRRVGAAGAGVAAGAWMVERVLDRPNAIGQGAERLARHGVWLAALWWICGAGAWVMWRYELLPGGRESEAA